MGQNICMTTLLLEFYYNLYIILIVLYKPAVNDSSLMLSVEGVGVSVSLILSIYFDKEQTSALLISTVTLSLPPFLSQDSRQKYLQFRESRQIVHNTS